MKLFLLKLKGDSKCLEELALSILDEELLSRYKKRPYRSRIHSLAGLLMLSYAYFKEYIIGGSNEVFMRLLMRI